MSVSDTDWALLDARLNEIERSIGILQAYVDTSLKEKYYGNSGAIGVAYALSEGSLSDAGTVQVWNNNQKLADCISTTKLEE